MVEMDNSARKAILRMMFGNSADAVEEHLPQILKLWGLRIETKKKESAGKVPNRDDVKSKGTIEEVITARERIEKVINLEVPDRVPVTPLIQAHAARIAGISTAKFYGSISPYEMDNTEKAVRICFEKYGGYDMVFPGCSLGTVYSGIYPGSIPNFQDVKLPGVDVSAYDQATGVWPEEPPMMDEKLYDYIIEEGWFRLLSFRKLGLVNTFLRPYIFSEKINSIISYWHDEKKVALYMMGAMQPFEVLSHARNMKNFIIDLYKRHEKIKEVCDTTVDGFIQSALVSAKSLRKYTNMIVIYCHRGSTTFLSPKLFEELYFPYLKKMVEEFANEGFVSSLHMDGNYGPVLEHFEELPKKKIILELDNFTDIFKVKEVLGDHACIRGNVPATLLAFGSSKEVEKYCRKLIDFVGEGGGFMLGSGCEVPINAKFENVKTMIDTAKKYGIYRK